MKKLINLCKLPMLIVSAVIFVAFTVLTILSYTMPIAKTFSYTEEKTEITAELKEYYGVDAKQKSTIVFLGNNVVAAYYELEFDEVAAKAAEMEYEVTEEEINESLQELKEINGVVLKYEVKDGKLYIDGQEFGHFKGNKFFYHTYELDENGDTKYELDEAGNLKLNENGEKIAIYKDVEISNSTNSSLAIASVVLMAVSAVCLACCVTLLVLDKVGVLSKKETATETAE